ncbi:MAG: hypothetical protein R2787_13875 [Saprospiraceae bacterium]
MYACHGSGGRRLLHEQQHDALYVWTTDNNGNVIIVSNMDSEGYFNFDLPVGFDYTFTTHGDRRLR